MADENFIDKARRKWQSEHGLCSMCDVGDRPTAGLHRGQHPCANDTSCLVCKGVLPPGEQCQACYRINVSGV